MLTAEQPETRPQSLRRSIPKGFDALDRWIACEAVRRVTRWAVRFARPVLALVGLALLANVVLFLLGLAGMVLSWGAM